MPVAMPLPRIDKQPVKSDMSPKSVPASKERFNRAHSMAQEAVTSTKSGQVSRKPDRFGYNE